MPMEKKNRNTVNEWCTHYERVRPDYLRFTTKIESLLSDILQARDIGYHLIEARTKDAASFREKIVRSSKSYTNPMEELTDLTGLRIITYYQDDAALIGELIKSEFDVDSTNSVEYSPIDSEFGYRSAHYVVRLSDSRGPLVEWAGLAGLRAEIQVRTVLQHAWAAISHKLQYKREHDVPTPLRRKLFRLSALFELADDEFVSLRDASGLLSRQIDSQLAEGNRNIRIDHVSLHQFIEQSLVVSELCVLAAEVGFSFDDPNDPDDSDRDTISDLVLLAGYARLNTLSQFENVLEGASSWAKAYFTEQYARNGSSDGDEWYVSPAFMCELVLIRSHISHLRPGYLLQLGWDRSIASRVFKVAQDFRPLEA
ncbi:GTP pyrophosphokinase [Paraburkholderia sediminicola]|uniref:GTP pyrophosphokinase n=1 Tax=Paraburkholderia sediminicola TaxID=458836 RepID=UPI0038BD3D97